VLAAVSLSAPFTEIGSLFEVQNPGVHVLFSFTGSQQLAQQIAQGAPADVFASASPQTMDTAVTSKRVARDSVHIFAKNRLVVIYPQDNPAGLEKLQDLAKPGVKLDLAAQEVPAGKYALEFLDKAAQDPAFSPSFKDDVIKNVVSYETNVRSILTKVSLGEADAGIVYLSDVIGSAASQVGHLDIPESLNVIAVYLLAPIADSQEAQLAKAFMDLVLSKTGQDILAKYVFIPAG
jgi:molybdate transport system substrate-binding protein